MKILVTSDLHLSERIWKHRPIEGDSRFAWEQIQQLAISEDCDGVILAGDILDRKVNSSAPVQWLTSGLQRLYQQHMRIWYTQGQHEYQQRPWAGLVSAAEHLHDAGLISVGGRKVAGIDYSEAEDLQRFLQDDVAGAADILVCHQVWAEFMGENCGPQGSFSDIPDNVELLITGDFHEHRDEVYAGPGMRRPLRVLSPGSTHMRSISEDPQKAVFLLEVGEEFSVTSLPLKGRLRFEMDLREMPDPKQWKVKLDEILQEAEAAAGDLPEELRRPLLRLIFRPSVDVVPKELHRMIQQETHLFRKPIIEEEEVTVFYDDDSADRADMLSCLETVVSRKEQPEVYDLSRRLLESPSDPEQQLQQWIQEKVQRYE